jgi:hypothetical protein
MGREVVRSLLDYAGVEMLDLLLGISKGWCACHGTIPLVREALNLTPTFTAPFRTALMISIQFGCRHLEEVLGQLLPNDGHSVDAFIAEHVQSVPVNCAVRQQNDLISIRTEASETCFSRQ